MPDRDLLVLSEELLNAETKLGERTGTITPAGSHYVRTHFPLPHAPREIAADGAVERPMSITFDEVRALPARTLAVTLECAGNGRRYLDPKAPGEQWGLGAVGTAEWTGTPLGALLERVAPDPKAVEVLFRGADEGIPKDLGRHIAYERALPVADALIMPKKNNRNPTTSTPTTNPATVPANELFFGLRKLPYMCRPAET